ncbi:hypothetical protein FNT36_12140 [Hymenobacter setariae]|uniref:STAS/SEC14 domain-containing protein n=1 Tax=Hymenobacter setariae TaxID=2594794 RepID=A0A558BUR6_9BACT|nr:STAS/SEC14 domain-containing protein [Hymenobacter setariae]TVT40232.1 hypothetical protein FNT36_12140 [Hymenobacter setariae]
MAIVYRTSYLLLHHDPTGATIETEWQGFVNSEQLRASLLEVLRLARQYRIKGYIANNVLLRTIRPADQDWINEVWFPEFAKLGVQRLAVVVSQDGLNRMGVDNIMQRATPHLPFDTQHFADAQAARQWAAVASTGRTQLA